MMFFITVFVLSMSLVIGESFWGGTWEGTEDELISVREGLEEWDALESQFLTWGLEIESPLLGEGYESHARVVREVRVLLEGGTLLMGWEEEAVELACEYLRECLKAGSF
jgi:hypothetical protein